MGGCMDISKNLSDKIDNYIKKLSCNISEDKIIIKDFEDEMKINFKISIVELINNGYSEEEAFKIAKNRFGDVNQIQTELTAIFKVQRRVQRNILTVVIISLMILITAFVSFIVFHKDFELRLPKEFQVAVEDKIKTGEEISAEEATKLLNKYKSKFRYIALSKGTIEDSVDILYPSSFSIEEVQSDYTLFLGTNVISPDGTQWSIRYGYDNNGFHTEIPHKLIKISIILLAVYWIFFSIWASISAYNIKKLSLAWVIMFLTMNVLAYIIFKIDCKVNLKLKMV